MKKINNPLGLEIVLDLGQKLFSPFNREKYVKIIYTVKK